MAFVSQWLGNGPATNYQNSPWSFWCRNARGANADFSLVNYATFFYAIPGPAGPVLFTSTQASNNYHSEKEVWMVIRVQGAFNRMDIPAWRTGELPVPPGTLRLNAAGVAALGTGIAVVYTERQPCPTCSPFLNDVLLNGTMVYWHFPYPGAETSKHSHSDDDIATNALMAISNNKTYQQNMKDHQRDYRKEGNAGLRGALRDVRGTQQSSILPPLVTAQRRIDAFPSLVTAGGDE
ncbi:MAG TPA: hypothetical protein VF618_09420 [Thermoanaerobaculia bacterium]